MSVTAHAEDVVDEPATSTERPASVGLAVSVVFVWIRTGLILASPPFETPDTSSYRSGQSTRPPLSSALLSWFADAPYVVLSALVSSVGVVVVCWALWDPDRRARSVGITGAVVAISLLPMVLVYEHWLVPDSLLVGLALLGVALALRPSPARWYPWLVIGLCAALTSTKEVGLGVVLLVCLVLAAKGLGRLALTVAIVCTLLFAIAVLPSSGREGRVFGGQPTSSELTMERVRVIIASMSWADVSEDLEVVQTEAIECGMSRQQLMAETFGLTDRYVDFSRCPELWEAVDRVSPLDLVVAHAMRPVHVPEALERGFAADMGAMASWSGHRLDLGAVLAADRLFAVAVAVLPIAALAVAAIRRKGLGLALTSVAASGLALTTTLLDPSSQERHSLVFRVLAFVLALAALTATDRSDRRSDRRAECSSEPSGSTTAEESRDCEELHHEANAVADLRMDPDPV